MWHTISFSILKIAVYICITGIHLTLFATFGLSGLEPLGLPEFHSLGYRPVVICPFGYHIEYRIVKLPAGHSVMHQSHGLAGCLATFLIRDAIFKPGLECLHHRSLRLLFFLGFIEFFHYLDNLVGSFCIFHFRVLRGGIILLLTLHIITRTGHVIRLNLRLKVIDRTLGDFLFFSFAIEHKKIVLKVDAAKVQPLKRLPPIFQHKPQKTR